VAVATYPQLFALLGYAYGGVGANFGIPDLRKRVVVGAGTAVALGANDGAAEAARNPIQHLHAAGNVTGAGGAGIGPISHAFTSQTYDGGETSTVWVLAGGVIAVAASGHAHQATAPDDHTVGGVNHTHGQGATNPLVNFPTFLGLNRIIYAGA